MEFSKSSVKINLGSAAIPNMTILVMMENGAKNLVVLELIADLIMSLIFHPGSKSSWNTTMERTTLIDFLRKLFQEF